MTLFPNHGIHGATDKGSRSIDVFLGEKLHVFHGGMEKITKADILRTLNGFGQNGIGGRTGALLRFGKDDIESYRLGSVFFERIHQFRRHRSRPGPAADLAEALFIDGGDNHLAGGG